MNLSSILALLLTSYVALGDSLSSLHLSLFIFKMGMMMIIVPE